MSRFLLLACLAGCAFAQPTVAPSVENVGEPRGQTTAGYNVRQSFELGYRYRTLGGNEDAYRSMVNFGDGLRLLSSSLSVQSLEGHGHFFDTIVLNTQGLGNDPYQYANLRIEKNRLYRYDLTWRSNAYFNPGLYAPAGQHFQDTVRHLQDQDITLFPQSWLRFFAGYSRNTQDGPGISTINLFDQHRGDVFPVFENIRRQQNEYRAGFEVKIAGFRLNLLHSWVNFKEDTPYSLTSPSPGINPADSSTLSSFTRTEPYHGNSPFWRVALFRESKVWAANGRFSYVTGRRSFATGETAGGTDRFGAAAQRQILSYGNARRPAATGDLTLSWFPFEHLTVTNQTSLYSIRMEGDSYLAETDNGGAPFPLLSFQYLGIRQIANATDAQFRLASWISLHGGYTFDTRRIRSIQTADVPGDPLQSRIPSEQVSDLNAGIAGVRLKPVKPLTVTLEAELGRNDRPIYPIAERNYHALRGRIEYKLRGLRIAAYSRTNYNNNGVALASFASHSRVYGTDFSLTLRSGFAIDVSYARQHIDTLGALQYFTLFDSRNQRISSDRSYYVSNIHSGTLSARWSLGRLDVSLGYSHVQDAGDGRASAVVVSPYSSQPAFVSAQTFPLFFRSPMARVSVSITPKIRWNAGYQHYGYGEDFGALRDFRAHTGYSSVLWSF